MNFRYVLSVHNVCSVLKYQQVSMVSSEKRTHGGHVIVELVLASAGQSRVNNIKPFLAVMAGNVIYSSISNSSEIHSVLRHSGFLLNRHSQAFEKSEDKAEFKGRLHNALKIYHLALSYMIAGVTFF